MKFIIKAYDYMPKVGGVIALHELGEVLAKLNQEVYLISSYTTTTSKAVCINEHTARNIIQEDDRTIVIYPEIVYGNPLNAKNVIRWVLYTPGVNGGDSIYDQNEHVFLYKTEFGLNTIYKDRQILNIFLSKTDIFYDMGKERSGDCFLKKKGDKIHSDFIQGYYLDSDIHKSSNIDEFLLETFNRYERFISYDTFTYHSFIAAMCGCTSIVMKNPQISKDIFYSEFYKYGIAYGIEDEAHSVSTKNLVKSHMEDKLNDSLETVNLFLQYCERNFY